MFGENVTLVEGLIITVVAMAIVLLVLLLLSGIIDLMRYSLQRFTTVNAVIESPKEINDNNINPKGGSSSVSGLTVDAELVAVISAAIATVTGRPTSLIMIQSIKRIQQETPLWGMASRQEQVYSRQTRQ